MMESTTRTTENGRWVEDTIETEAIDIKVMYTADEALAKARALIAAAGNCWTKDGTNEGRKG